MITILHSADWHIHLYKKKVPYEWLEKRIELFFEKLLTIPHDIHIISGDVFDKKPEPDEVALLLRYLNRVEKPTFIIPGNHEATGRGKTFFEHFTSKHTINNPNVRFITENELVTCLDVKFQFFPYNKMQLDELPTPDYDAILVTHIRGEVPPHITAEYDFDKLTPWKLTLLGDLHFAHKYKNYAAYYSGSPMNVSFDRNRDKEYGVNIIKFKDIDHYDVQFVDLNLPRLLRLTVKAGTELKSHDVDHVVYEVKGSIDELSKLANHELLDKKIAAKPDSTSKLNLKDLPIIEELALWLDYAKIDKEGPINEFKALGLVT